MLSYLRFYAKENVMSCFYNKQFVGGKKCQIDQIDKDKKKTRDEVGSSDVAKDSQESKIEEISKLIKNLSNKLRRLETGGSPPHKPPKKESMRNPNQFRRPLNPHLFRRDRRNDEQPLIPPINNNNEKNVVDDLGGEESIDFQEELHLI